ncbi:MGH1-like glycoside hydrolase domain-containing protein [Paenibacillus agricola]|uniref:Mannosylglycerate hydrolase MGH1-like glycoside hydrolase domain-containing protein n=1 Tax=Paenibacillus agricola TaxID=2716264 RepID=A0ABX0JF75_9BACL|nr:trehalase family glycosidase [Paenibacillus agricola]NHN35195.1 hypothetical protein [Paenibacillus agricola]
MHGIEKLRSTHDLHLPTWGPYTKQYAGISHLPDIDSGLRFDLSVFGGLYRRKVDIPNVMWESGFHPWEAAADLSYYAYRQQLEWKDQVYCDISYSAWSECARLIRCECINNTNLEQTLVVNWMASLHAPQVSSHKERLRAWQVELPELALWVDALDYRSLGFAVPKANDSLVYDGWIGGEERKHEFVGGCCLGREFGKDQGDTVTYQLRIPSKLYEGMLLIRYRMAAGDSAVLSISGLGDQDIRLEGSGALQTAAAALGVLDAGDYVLTIVSAIPAPLELDGFVIVNKASVEQVVFSEVPWNPVPGIRTGPVPESLLLAYDHTEGVYGLGWDFEAYEIREYHHSELDRFMRHHVHDHVHDSFQGDGQGHYTNVFMRPLFLPPQTSKVVYGIICEGSITQVNEELQRFREARGLQETRYLAAKAGAADRQPNPAGETYRFSQQLLAAVMQTNVVYPVYTKRSYIRHSTPGRWWDSLYTWDSGFIGLGLLELDTQRAVDTLNAYVTEEDDEQAAFIHHGSPVPVQHYLYLELWSRTQSRELLQFFYPKLRRYYLFLNGSLGSSTTAGLASGLLQTWDYFYNSGGWDDYPAQVQVHRQKCTASTAPAITSSHCIRIAKILRMAALELGECEQDIKEYDESIKQLSKALQEYAWEENSQYFGYVVHEKGGAANILRDEDGNNYNCGLDGVYPLMAGICTSEQQAMLLSHLFSPEELWTPIGIGAVSQSAPYYRKDGYWNGTVWMAHQWFVWKTMFDLGKGEQARLIAETALQVWKRETEATYNCFEHFIVETGRGAGWHQFGALSSPVMSWYAAYHKPGTLTVGLDIWIKERTFNNRFTELEARMIRHGSSHTSNYTFLVCMTPGDGYAVLWNDKQIAYVEPYNGVFEITVPCCEEEGKLNIKVESY